LKKSPAIDSVVFVVMRDVVGHEFVSRLVGNISFTCFYRIAADLFPESFAHSGGGEQF